MAKQVHIHIHRNKTRDAGEGEGKGKWITLSPSGTHVKVNGSGEITAGPKGLTGKKPSELSKGKPQSGGKPEKSAAQKFSSKLASLNRLLNQAPDGSAQAKHIQSQIRATKLQQEKANLEAKKAPSTGKPEGGVRGPESAPTSQNQKIAAEMRKASKDPVKQAREWEEKASALQVKAQQEYTRNGKSDEYMRLRNEAQEAYNKGTDIMAQAVAQSKGKIEAPKPPAVSMASLKEGQALYDKSGQKVDEVESIQRRTLGKGLTINTRAGYQVHIDENGSNSQGWSNEKPGASGAAPTSQNQKIAAEMSKASKPKAPSTTKTESYSWGKLTKVGNVNESAIAHPQDRQKIGNLGHGDSYSYTDEQGKQWQVTRYGDEVTFTKPGEKQPSLSAPIREFQDSQAGPKEVPLDTKRTDWKQR